jgi:uncharacterized phiE125 gp8 family phage protein
VAGEKTKNASFTELHLNLSEGLKMAFYETSTEPALEPVSLAEVRAHMIIDDSIGTDDDDVITGLIVAARIHVEKVTGKAMITRTMAMVLNHWPVTAGQVYAPGGTLEIKRGPFQSVTKVETFNEDGDATVWAADNYYSNPSNGRGVLCPKGQSYFPTPTRAVAGIRVEFTAGYGGASDVPESLTLAVKMLVAHWYEHREAVAVDKDARPTVSHGVPHGFDALVGKYKTYRLM